MMSLFLSYFSLKQHAMLFFLHHCELPSLANVRVLNAAPVNLHLHLQPVAAPQHVEDHDALQEEDASGDDQEDSTSEREGNEQLVGDSTPESNDSLVNAVDQEISGHGSPGPNENHLMRSQLHRTSSDTIGASVSSVVASSSQASSYQTEQRKLSDEELRLVRLQRFDKRH